MKQIRFTAQVDEDRHLGAQHFGIDGLIEKIHGASIIAAKKMLVVLVGRDEQDRRVARTLPFANQGGGLEAVHLRHLDVQQDDRKVVVQELAQSFLAGRRLDQILSQILQDRFQGEQIRRTVVDQQDLYTLVWVARSRSRLVRYPSGHCVRLLKSDDSLFHRTLDAMDATNASL